MSAIISCAGSLYSAVFMILTLRACVPITIIGSATTTAANNVIIYQVNQSHVGSAESFHFTFLLCSIMIRIRVDWFLQCMSPKCLVNIFDTGFSSWKYTDQFSISALFYCIFRFPDKLPDSHSLEIRGNHCILVYLPLLYIVLR